MKLITGHNINVHYKGTLTDGTEFDNSRTRGQTIAFQVGSGQMIPGFNDAVVGMATGETKSVTLAPTEAYGPRNEEALNTVPREAFGENFEFEVGATIQGNGPRGVFLAKIHDLQEENVILDMNHPLAGQSLNFEIELVSVNEATVISATWSPTMKKAELLGVAKTLGLDVNTRTTKAQLVAALSA